MRKIQILITLLVLAWMQLLPRISAQDLTNEQKGHLKNAQSSVELAEKSTVVPVLESNLKKAKSYLDRLAGVSSHEKVKEVQARYDAQELRLKYEKNVVQLKSLIASAKIKIKKYTDPKKVPEKEKQSLSDYVKNLEEPMAVLRGAQTQQYAEVLKQADEAVARLRKLLGISQEEGQNKTEGEKTSPKTEKAPEQILTEKAPEHTPAVSPQEEKNAQAKLNSTLNFAKSYIKDGRQIQTNFQAGQRVPATLYESAIKKLEKYIAEGEPYWKILSQFPDRYQKLLANYQELAKLSQDLKESFQKQEEAIAAEEKQQRELQEQEAKKQRELQEQEKKQRELQEQEAKKQRELQEQETEQWLTRFQALGEPFNGFSPVKLSESNEAQIDKLVQEIRVYKKAKALGEECAHYYGKALAGDPSEEWNRRNEWKKQMIMEATKKQADSKVKSFEKQMDSRLANVYNAWSQNLASLNKSYLQLQENIYKKNQQGLRECLQFHQQELAKLEKQPRYLPKFVPAAVIQEWEQWILSLGKAKSILQEFGAEAIEAVPVMEKNLTEIKTLSTKLEPVAQERKKKLAEEEAQKAKQEAEKVHREQDEFEKSLSEDQKKIYEQWGKKYPSDRAKNESGLRWVYEERLEKEDPSFHVSLFYSYFFDGQGKLIKEVKEKNDLYLPLYYQGDLLGYITVELGGKLYTQYKGFIVWNPTIHYGKQQLTFSILSGTIRGASSIDPIADFQLTGDTSFKIIYYPRGKAMDYYGKGIEYQFGTGSISQHRWKSHVMGWDWSDGEVLEVLVKGACYWVLFKQ